MNSLENIVDLKLQDLEISGVVIEFEPFEAEYIGAFVEDALTVEEALESMFDGEE